MQNWVDDGSFWVIDGACLVGEWLTKDMGAGIRQGCIELGKRLIQILDSTKKRTNSDAGEWKEEKSYDLQPQQLRDNEFKV